jgi:hypothetical protein
MIKSISNTIGPICVARKMQKVQKERQIHIKMNHLRKRTRALDKNQARQRSISERR